MFSSNTSQVSSDATFVEDVFSTYLYTGNATARSITNGIDLAGKGGMVWFKDRSQAYGNRVFDTNRGTNKLITTNTTAAEFSSYTNMLTAFNADGFSIGDDSSAIGLNVNSDLMVSWTFRKQPKFFDVVTYTGNGTNRTISHSLGSVPGCIIVKRTDTTADWQVYHRSLANTEYLVLNTTAAKATGATRWNSTTPTSTEFSLGTDATVNANGGTYVAYLFAHDAGGFGTSGADNVISCGSFVSTGANQRVDINLGYQPQWVLVKRSDSSGNWNLLDSMRGFPAVNLESSNDPTSKVLWPNLSSAEGDYSIALRTNGFSMPGGQFTAAGETYIYIAIRRGPMKTPTSGTSVYYGLSRSGTSTNTTVTGSPFPVDLAIIKNSFNNDAFASNSFVFDRLRGPLNGILANTTDAESSAYTNSLTGFDVQNGYKVGSEGSGWVNWSGTSGGATYMNWMFRRAPGFMDVVCYSGTGSNTTQTHNLGVTPELIIVKRRGATSAWPVYSAALANTEYLVLNTTAAKATGATYWNSTTPTSTVFSLGTAADVNASGSTGTYVAYLFASLPGVSKVGSYTGTGASLNIDCGFTGGARFVLIKRTNASGAWYVYDTTRGIVSGNEVYMMLNDTQRDTTADHIAPLSSGFQLTSGGSTTVNVNGGTYIYLAIA